MPPPAAEVELQARILAHLVACPGLTSHEIARALGLIDGYGRARGIVALTALIRLEDAGKVRRGGVPERRTWHPVP